MDTELHVPRNVGGGGVGDEPGNLGVILRRIDELLELNGLSQRGASKLAGNPDYIRTMRAQHEGKAVIKDGKRVILKQYSADPEKLRRLVGPLNTTWEWLWYGTGTKFLPQTRGRPRKTKKFEKGVVARERYRVLARSTNSSRGGGGSGLVVSGTVQADSFFEADQVPDDPSLRVPIDPNYPADTQSALLVRGTSVNDVAEDGDCLIVTAIDADTNPEIGQIVIVSRIKSRLVETTARRFNIVDKQIELTLPSSDPRYRDREPLRIPASATRTLVDDTEIELRGVVVYVYRQV